MKQELNGKRDLILASDKKWSQLKKAKSSWKLKMQLKIKKINKKLVNRMRIRDLTYM